MLTVIKHPFPGEPKFVDVPIEGGFAPASVSSSRYLQFSASNPDMRNFSIGFFWRIHPTYSTQWVQPVTWNTNYVMEFQLPIGSTGYVQLYWNADVARITLTSSEYDSGDLFYSFVSHVTGRTRNTLWNLTKGWVKEVEHGSTVSGTSVTTITLGTMPAGSYSPGMMYNFKMWYNPSGDHTRDWAEQEMRSFEPIRQQGLIAWYPLSKHYGPNSALNGRPALTTGGSTAYNYNGLPTTFMLQRKLEPFSLAPIMGEVTTGTPDGPGILSKPPIPIIHHPYDSKPDSVSLELDRLNPISRGARHYFLFGPSGVYDAANQGKQTMLSKDPAVIDKSHPYGPGFYFDGANGVTPGTALMPDSISWPTGQKSGTIFFIADFTQSLAGADRRFWSKDSGTEEGSHDYMLSCVTDGGGQKFRLRIRTNATTTSHVQGGTGTAITIGEPVLLAARWSVTGVPENPANQHSRFSHITESLKEHYVPGTVPNLDAFGYQAAGSGINDVRFGGSAYTNNDNLVEKAWYFAAGMWDRCLTDLELEQIFENPWALLQPQTLHFPAYPAPFRRMMDVDHSLGNYPTEKPNGPLEINWSHPLMDKIEAVYVADEPYMRELTGRYTALLRPAPYTPPGWRPRPEGVMGYADGFDYTSSPISIVNGGSAPRFWAAAAPEPDRFQMFLWSGQWNLRSAYAGNSQNLVQMDSSGTSQGLHVNVTSRVVGMRHSGGYQLASNYTISNGEYFTVAGQWAQLGPCRIFINGRKDAEGTGANVSLGNATQGAILESFGDRNSGQASSATLHNIAIWGKTNVHWTDEELASISANPWQILKAPRQQIIIPREHLLQIDTQFNDTKPEGEAQIDWNNPLTEGLSMFMYPITDDRVYEAVFGDLYQMGEIKPVGTETWSLEPTKWGMGIRAGGNYSLGFSGPRFTFKNNNRFSQGQNPALCMATWQRTISPPITGNTTTFALYHPSYQFSNMLIQSKQFGCQTVFQVGSSANSANIEDTAPGTIDNIPTLGPREDTFIWGQRIPGASANTAKITKTRINYTDSSEWIIRYADQLNAADWTNVTYSVNDFQRAAIAQSDNNIVACVAIWNRNLTEEELITLGDNPWQILKRKIFIPTNYEPYLMPVRIPWGTKP